MKPGENYGKYKNMTNDTRIVLIFKDNVLNLLGDVKTTEFT